MNHIFQKLPPLIFQCSSECTEEEDLSEKSKEIYAKLFNSSENEENFDPNSYLLCCLLEADDIIIRDYLLKPEKRIQLSQNNYFLVKKLDHLWPIFLDKYFLVIHFIYEDNQISNPKFLLNDPNEIEQAVIKSNLHLGVLFKKNLSGKKIFVKTLGEDFNEEIQKNGGTLQREKPQAKKNFLNALFNTVNGFFGGGMSTATPSLEGSPNHGNSPSKTDVNQISKLDFLFSC